MENYLIELLKKDFDLNDFYVINIYNTDFNSDYIQLQGFNSPEKLYKYTQLGYEFKSQNEWVVAKKGNIKITLTSIK